MKSKYIIITGSTGGIGNQLAKLCLDRIPGMKGCFLYRDQDKFEKSFDGCLADGIDTYLFHMEKVNQINIDAIMKKHSKIHTIILVLVSFTIEPLKRIEEQEISEVIKNINVNIVSQINILLEVLKYAKQNNIELKVISIDSGAAYRAIEGWSLYSSSKSYMNMYLKSLKLEEEIDIVTYDPGVVDTNMQAIIRSQKEDKYSFVKQFKDYYINGKLKSPHAVAEDILERYILDWKAIDFEERYQQK